VQYISVEGLRYACEVLQTIREAQEQGLDATLGCGCQLDSNVAPCGKPAEYLVPDSSFVPADANIEQVGPQWRCREHLELELGEPVKKQPLFRRVENHDDLG
jgi:hypothetical protein